MPIPTCVERQDDRSPKREEVLDIYHALEHLSDCGTVLYGAETKEYKVWREETTLELIWSGFERIEKRPDDMGREK